MERESQTPRPPGWGGAERLPLRSPTFSPDFSEQARRQNRIRNYFVIWRGTRAWLAQQWNRRRSEERRRSTRQEGKINMRSLMGMARLAVDLAASAERRRF